MPPLPYPYMVPGGRVTEIYYWDSYFISERLTVSGKLDIVESMVKNFAYLIEKYEHVPNSSRAYYLSRSQPPFFCSMVNILFRYKGPDTVLPFLPVLEKEYRFWMNGKHAVPLGGFILNRSTGMIIQCREKNLAGKICMSVRKPILSTKKVFTET